MDSYEDPGSSRSSCGSLPGSGDGREESVSDIPLSRNRLVEEQERDSEITSLFAYALLAVELEKVLAGYFVKDGVFMRKSRSPNVPASEDWSVSRFSS